MRRQRCWLEWGGAGVFSYCLLFGALAAFSGIGLLDASQAVAQDDQLDAPAAGAPAADAPAAKAPAAAAPAPATGGQLKPDQSYLQWLASSLGWMYSIVFLALSFSLVALFVMNLLALRRENVVPVALVEGFENHLNEKRYQEAYELAKNDESFLGQVLSAGLAKLSAGYEPAIEAMQEVAEEESMKLDHRLSYIGLIGTISPMVGLLGTVDGMIASFSVIANSPTAPKPSELATGIATALFTTLVGLWLAIPAIAAYNILRNRVARLVLEVGILGEGLMSRFSNVGGSATAKKK